MIYSPAKIKTFRGKKKKMPMLALEGPLKIMGPLFKCCLNLVGVGEEV